MIIIVENTYAAEMNIPDEVLELPAYERGIALSDAASEIKATDFQNTGFDYRFFTEDGEELT